MCGGGLGKSTRTGKTSGRRSSDGESGDLLVAAPVGLRRRVGAAAAPAWSCGGGGYGWKRAVETLELRWRRRPWADLELSQQRKSTAQGSP